VSDTTEPVDVVAVSLAATAAGPPRLRELCAGLDDRDCLRKPGVGKLSLAEHLWHLRDMERDVFGPRMRQVLAENDPTLVPLDVEEHEDRDLEPATESLADVVAAWAEARAENIALVEGTTPEQWERPLLHPLIGRARFIDLVRRWGRHDAEHLRQIEILALNCRERNLP